MQTKKRELINLSSFVEFCKKNIESIDDDFCLYSEDAEEPLSASLNCYIDDYPTGDEEGEDLFSDFVNNNGLELIYYGGQFIDVIKNVLMQAANPNVELIINALNYYMDNDDFIDIDS